MNNISTNKNCIIRLSKYKKVLQRLALLGFIKVFSDNLADSVGVTAAQVRKDFSLFGITGNKKGGYTIIELISSLSKILGKDITQKVVLVGLGNLGQALTKYPGFEKDNIQIVAAFDVDANKHNPAGTPPVLSLDKLTPFIKENNIKLGMIAVPDIAAQQILDIMVAAGIKGVLNFAPISLRGDENIVITNINLAAELDNVIYFVNAAIRDGKRG